MPLTTGYFGKRGELRIYSGTLDGVGGNYYFQVAFEQGDLTFPAGRSRPDELPVLDRGLYTSYAHYLQGPDTPIINPLQVTFTAQIETAINKVALLQAMVSPLSPTGSAWTVNGFAWSNVNGTSVQVNGFGSAVSTAPPYDPTHQRINLAALWRADTTGTSDTGFNLREVYFRPDNVKVTESLESLKMSVTGWIYGPVSQVSNFDAGTDISR
jgi:hypothetical protein